MIFDHNNNSEECQMFFDKINNGSPFRVITFIGPILSHFKNVMRSGYLSSEPTKQDRIKSFLVQTFNLKNYLLVLAKMHCNPTSDLLLRKQARRTKHQHKRDKIPKCKKS